MLRAQFPRTQLIEAENSGMGAGNNLGLRALNEQSAPFASLILNPDTVVRPGALRHLLEFLHAHPQAGVVAPKLLNPDGSLQHSGFRFPGLTQALLDLFPPPGRLARLINSPLNGRYPASAYAAGRPFQVDHTLGAAFLVRQAALVASGLFDETFEMYCEEIDWQWRLARAGWERWIVPSAEVIHYGGQSTAQVPLESLRKLWISRRRLYQRYQGVLVNALLSYFVQLAMRQRIRANHRRSQQGHMDADHRAEMNRTLTEIMRVWRGRRVG
jgi:N-acetylglucosaminyl-diphospho-decaprenol L-rhamnosyltransferase